jgi:hypothetical protein
MMIKTFELRQTAQLVVSNIPEDIDWSMNFPEDGSVVIESPCYEDIQKVVSQFQVEFENNNWDFKLIPKSGCSVKVTELKVFENGD